MVSHKFIQSEFISYLFPNGNGHFPILPLARTSLEECEERISVYLFPILPLDRTSLGECEERASKYHLHLGRCTRFSFQHQKLML
jgi:hypothetical protein